LEHLLGTERFLFALLQLVRATHVCRCQVKNAGASPPLAVLHLAELLGKLANTVRMSCAQPVDHVDGLPPGGTLKEAQEELEREMVREVRKRHGGKIRAAAEELAVSRLTFYELMEKLGIS
jgi:DNA-binding NtrC family response regulator